MTRPKLLLAVFAVALVAVVVAWRVLSGGAESEQGGALLVRLSANEWCNRREVAASNPRLPETSRSYVFGSDGDYKLSHSSDYLERSGDGNWSFTQRTDSAGV